MLEVKEQKVEEDFCLWLGYDGEDTVQVVWIFVRETWRLNSAVGGSEVSGTVLGTCSGRKKNTVLTMQLHPDSLTCCGNSMIFDGLCIHFWTFSVAQELCELPARMESVIFKAFCGWRNKVCTHWSGQYVSKSLRQLWKHNPYASVDPLANYSKNLSRKEIPPKVTQSQGCDVPNQPLLCPPCPGGGPGRPH